MIFQKSSPRVESAPAAPPQASYDPSEVRDEVETVVGPSVHVEGDFASQGNIIVKGSVAGSVHTSRHLSVEAGAKIMANVKAGSAQIAGEVKGNMKVKDTLELTATAKILGDIEVKTLIVEGGALICGKVFMPGIEGAENKTALRSSRPAIVKKIDDATIAG